METLYGTHISVLFTQRRWSMNNTYNGRSVNHINWISGRIVFIFYTNYRNNVYLRTNYRAILQNKLTPALSAGIRNRHFHTYYGAIV